MNTTSPAPEKKPMILPPWAKYFAAAWFAFVAGWLGNSLIKGAPEKPPAAGPTPSSGIVLKDEKAEEKSGSASPSVEEPEDFGADWVAIQTAARPGEENPLLMERLRKVLQENRRSRRARAWSYFLAAVRVEDVLAVREMLRAGEREGGEFAAELALLWAQWGTVNGPAAMKQAEVEGSRPADVDAIMKAWGYADSKAAVAWIKKNGRKEWRDAARGALLLGLAERSAQEAEALFRSDLEDPAFRLRFSELGREYTQQIGLEKAQDWTLGVAADTSLPEDVRKRAMECTIELTARNEAKGLAGLLAKLEASKEADASWAVAVGKAGASFAGNMVEELAKFPGDSPHRLLATQGLFEAWAAAKAEDATAWLQAHRTDAAYDHACAGFVRAVAGKDAEAADEWRETIKSEAVRKSLEGASGGKEPEPSIQIEIDG